jgi:hypothetical protein
MPFIGKQPQTGAYSKLDAITTSATATYNLTLDGGAYYPQSANHLLVSLNGVMQAPQDSFTVSGSQITFASALTSSDNIDFIMALGDTLDIGVPSAGSVNTSQLANSAVTATKIGSGAVEGAMVTPFGRRNVIINGDMRIAQRGTSTSGIGILTYGACDRMELHPNLSAVSLTQEQVEDAPSGSGLLYSSKVTVDTTSTYGSGNYLAHPYYVEGYDMQRFKFGTADAKDFTLSFWVKSSIAGQYSVAFQNQGNDRNFMVTYNIDSADTWEYKTMTISGDTGGTWNYTNQFGIKIWMSLGVGSSYAEASTLSAWQSDLVLGATNDVKLAETSGATWQITGLQMELGSVATPFEHRSYGEELALCQRYYWRSTGSNFHAVASGNNRSTTNARVVLPNPVYMRVSPSLSISGTMRGSSGSGNFDITSVAESWAGINSNMVGLTTSGLTTGNGFILHHYDNSSNYIQADAEL